MYSSSVQVVIYLIKQMPFSTQKIFLAIGTQLLLFSSLLLYDGIFLELEAYCKSPFNHHHYRNKSHEENSSSFHRPVTVVSGYWKIPSKRSHNDYLNYFNHSLHINAPYVFFYEDDQMKDLVHKIRGHLPTVFVYRNLSLANFSRIDYGKYNASWTHKYHAPSVALARIWIGKFSLIADAARLNPFRSAWFAWIDAGICIYRDQEPPARPWPNMKHLRTLPTDKILFSSSPENEPHNVTGTFMYRRELAIVVESLVHNQYEICERTRSDWRCGSDQCLLTDIQNAHPNFFHKVATGYGDIIPKLY